MIIRVHKTSNYTVMSNHHLRNKNISLKAKGLMSFMLSCEDGASFSIVGLATQSTDGETCVKSALKELKEFGYLKHYAKKDDKGRILDWVYDLYENPEAENPHVENPDVENPHVENHLLLNTNSINGSKEPTNSINKSSIKKEEKEKADDDFVDAQLLDTWKKWLQHRNQSGKPYKSSVSKKAAYDKLMKLANGDVYTAEQIIMQSLEHAWLGFFELKQQYGTANNSTCSQGAAATSAGYSEARRRIEERLREKLSGNDVRADV